MDLPKSKSEEWSTEQANILRKIDQHRGANRSYPEEGTRLLELAQVAVTLYEKQEIEEKRRLLNSVLLSSTWKNGKLIPAYRTPFDLLALTNTAYQKEKAVSSKKDGLFEIWLPFIDSFQTFISTPTGEVRETLEAIQCFALP